MKIIETIRKGEYDEDYSIDIKVVTEKGEKSVSFGSGEPEDMTLGRDLSGAYSISDLIEMAYEAGKNGEDFAFEQKEVEDED